MTRRLGFVLVGALAALCAFAVMSDPLLAKSETVSPSSGAVGTSVTISDLDSCEQGTATFDSESTPGGSYTTSGSVTLIVPASAEPGQHWIWLSCTNGGSTSVGAASFTVIGAVAVQAEPRFTG